MLLDNFVLPPLPSTYSRSIGGQPPVDSPRSLHARYVLRRYLEDLPEPVNLPPSPEIRTTRAPVKIGIVGAGVAGLYAAMIIDSLGPSLSYEIFEASDRVGGRLYTHKFKTGNPNDYYDVGAMRFPDIPFMGRTFDLFRRLSIKPIEYFMSRDNNINLFNGKKLTNKQVEEENKKGNYDPFLTAVSGLTGSTDALISAQIGSLKSELKSNFQEGWKKLMKLDTWSTRGYMTNEGTTYPNALVSYLETMDTGTGLYDQALTETVLDSLTFDYEDGVKWFCIQGGMEQVAQKMRTSHVRGPVHLNKRITAISIIPSIIGGKGVSLYKARLGISGDTADKTFDHVISTVPFGALRNIDTSGCRFGWELSTAIRALHYDNSTKVGICFSRRWWEDAGIDQRGGVSSTDRPTRIVVYPSYGIDGAGGAGASIIVSYTWAQDAARLGALVQGKESVAEEHLIDLILGDLAVMHDIPKKELQSLVVEYHAFNFYRDENTAGAFALFGPGQFESLYHEVNKPHAGVLHFAGEATSVHHAWVVGALNSAYRSVYEIVYQLGDKKLLKKLVEEWGRVDEFEPEVLDIYDRLGRAVVIQSEAGSEAPPPS